MPSQAPKQPKRPRGDLIGRRMAHALAAGLLSLPFLSPAPILGQATTPATPAAPAQVAPDLIKPAGPRAEPPALSSKEQQELDFFLDTIRNAKLELIHRQRAAELLLDRQWPQAVKKLAAELSVGDQQSQRAIAEALAIATTPPEECVKPLLALIDSPVKPLRQSAARALSRYKDAELSRELIRRAKDAKLEASKRLGPIEALSGYRQQHVASSLYELTQDRDASIRSAAFQALGNLTGNTEYGEDARAWSDWMDQTRYLSPDRWLDQLVVTISAKNAQLLAKQDGLVRRLTEMHAQLYLITAEKDRPDLLQKMLIDKEEAVRIEAMRIVDRSLEDSKPIKPEVKTALSKRLLDDVPRVRAEAAAVLSRMGIDAAVLETIARRVLEEVEPVVLDSYFKALAGGPAMLPEALLPDTIERAMSLMASQAVRNAAATFLYAAYANTLLSPDQSRQILEISRDHLSNDESPDPAIARLVGRMGAESDHPLILRLLEHKTPAVKKAAAEVFIENQALPLESLLAHLKDEEVSGVAIAAARKRGAKPQIVITLLDNEPTNADLRKAWEEAIREISGRLSPASILQVDKALAAKTKLQPLREQLLQASVEKISKVETETPDPSIHEMQLLLAGLYLKDRPALAKGVFEQLRGRTGLDMAMRQRLELGLLEAYLASGSTTDDQSALTLGKQIVTDRGMEQLTPVATVFLDQADKAREDKKTTRSTTLLDMIETHFSQNLGEQARARIKMIRDKLKNPTAETPPRTSAVESVFDREP